MSILDGLSKYDRRQLQHGRLTFLSYAHLWRRVDYRRGGMEEGDELDRLVVRTWNRMVSAAQKESEQ